MTLYYSLVFGVLVSEMVLFVLLVMPMPFVLQRKLFIFLSENRFVGKIQYAMKITFIFIAILFLDSVNRVWRVRVEKQSMRDGQSETFGGPVLTEIHARQFYSQRNMYLCGFTLFLSLILNRVFIMNIEMLRLQERIKSFQGDPQSNRKASKALDNAANVGEMGELGRVKDKLVRSEAKVKSTEARLKALQKDYDLLSDAKLATTAESYKKDK